MVRRRPGRFGAGRCSAAHLRPWAGGNRWLSLVLERLRVGVACLAPSFLGAAALADPGPLRPTWPLAATFPWLRLGICWLVSCDRGLARSLTTEIMNFAFFRLSTGSGPHGTVHRLTLICPAHRWLECTRIIRLRTRLPCPHCGLATGSTGRLARPTWIRNLPGHRISRTPRGSPLA